MLRAAALVVCAAALAASAPPEPAPLEVRHGEIRAKRVADKKAKRQQMLKRIKWEMRARSESARLDGNSLSDEEVAAAKAREVRASAFVLRPHAAPLGEEEEEEEALAPGEFRGATRMLYADPVHKIAFCAIPKVACTEFIRLIYRLRGDKLWWTEPHFRAGAPTLTAVGRDGANAILNDPNWTKAVFFRDPAARLLSAYLDKFVDSPGRGVHGDYGLRHFGRKLDWRGFVDAVTSNATDRTKPEGLHLGTNAHWKPQYYQCGLEKFLPHFSFVGRYENLRDHAETFLRSRGLWAEFGASGWAPRSRGERLNPSAAAPAPLRDDLFGRAAKHHTNSARRRDDYLTPDILAKIRAAYDMDYALFDALGAHPDAPPTTGLGWRRTRKRLCDLGVPKDRRAFGQHCIVTCPDGRQVLDCANHAAPHPKPAPKKKARNNKSP